MSEQDIAIIIANSGIGAFMTPDLQSLLPREVKPRKVKRRGVHAPFTGIPQPARNKPCPCGSGKKYKKCCSQSGDKP